MVTRIQAENKHEWRIAQRRVVLPLSAGSRFRIDDHDNHAGAVHSPAWLIRGVEGNFPPFIGWLSVRKQLDQIGNKCFVLNSKSSGPSDERALLPAQELGRDLGDL